tara:strand:+ start:714 stop:1202 length:489 start_codon:yes stop_codon:yes gene_type:complete
MVAMAILSLVCVGALSAILQTRRMTENSIYFNTATAVAHGYLEQIKNMEFTSLDVSPLPTLVNQGTSDPLIVSPGVTDTEIGNSGSDIINTKTIDINNTPDNAVDDMTMEIVVYISDLTNLASGVDQTRGITLRYKYLYNSNLGDKSYENTIFSIRSEVQTF